MNRLRLRSSPVFETLLLVAGIVVTAVGAPVARSGALVTQLPLFVVIVLIAAGAVLLARRAPQQERRWVALATIGLLLVTIPVTRIPSPGETIVVLGVVISGLTVFGLAGARLRLPIASVPAALLIGLLAVVTVISPDRYALLRFAPFVIAAVSIALLILGATADIRRRLARFVVVVAIAESVLAAVEPLIGNPQLWTPAKINAAGVVKTLPNPFLPELARAQGTLGHPLVLGVLLLVAVALLVGNVVRFARVPRIVLALVLAVGLLASGSRNSLAIAALLAIVFLPRWRAGRRAGLAIVGIVIVVILAAFVFAPVIGRWLASGSTTHRLGALDALGPLLSQPVLRLLFGNGWASTTRMFGAGLLQNDGLHAVDEQFVLLLSQAGIVGVALFVLVLVLAARRLPRSLLPAFLAVVITCLVFDLLVWPAGALLAAGVLAAGASPPPEPFADPQKSAATP